MEKLLEEFSEEAIIQLAKGKLIFNKLVEKTFRNPKIVKLQTKEVHFLREFNYTNVTQKKAEHIEIQVCPAEATNEFCLLLHNNFEVLLNGNF